jgi:hypothetical protein
MLDGMFFFRARDATPAVMTVPTAFTKLCFVGLRPAFRTTAGG